MRRSLYRGSPPRMRGKRCVFESLIVCIGITPADAGKTSSFFCQPSGAEDHPRGCGENYVNGQYAEKPRGSPPRMRGKHPVPQKTECALGITPADAGKTGGCSHNSRAHEDHPRGCGENGRCSLPPPLSSGSPPRMRGKPLFRALLCPLAGITPADAGKTGLLLKHLSSM